MPKVENLYRTPEDWAASNPVLGAGQIGVERFTSKKKVGDGERAWLQLNYFVEWSDLSGFSGGGASYPTIPLNSDSASSGQYFSQWSEGAATPFIRAVGGLPAVGEAMGSPSIVLDAGVYYFTLVLRCSPAEDSSMTELPWVNHNIYNSDDERLAIALSVTLSSLNLGGVSSTSINYGPFGLEDGTQLIYNTPLNLEANVDTTGSHILAINKLA